jgi:uncharacterized membrane protein (UPF0127 family)
MKMTNKETAKKAGFFVKTSTQKSWQVVLMSNEESPPQSYQQAYVILPAVDADLVRITRQGDKIVKRDPVQYRAGKPFVVEPPPEGHTYSLLNSGGSISFFEKRPIGHNDCMPTEPLPTKLPLESVAVVNNPKADKVPWYFRVEVLSEQCEWLTGYKFRTPSPTWQDEGLLFDWAEYGSTMWGMETLQVNFPTDFAFLDANGVIRSARYNVPRETKAIDPVAPARAVLETPGGSLESRGIKIGDTVHHRIFGNAMPAPRAARV